MKTGDLLIVDDDSDILTAGKLLLKRQVNSITTCADPSNIPGLMASNNFDVILLDMNFGPGESDGKQGLMWLEKILQIDPQAVVILITAHGGVNIAVNAMKLGATDFIIKPWQNEKLQATVSSALKLKQSRSEVNTLKRTNEVLAESSGQPTSPLIWGESVAMAQVMTMLERAAPTDANVLILGENGTGKELVARAIHKQSLRGNNVFVSVDLGTISESLFESELFGHKKGAFTGANEDRVGRMQAAHGGTLFLDEIGNLPLHLQSRLLTALEQRKVTPVGSNESIAIDVRLVAATNMSAAKLADPEHFRQDLLFRLNTVELSIPPLRERPEDIPSIARHYVELYCKKYAKTAKLLSQSALDAMCSYSWPGNVRALRHAVERAVILSDRAVLEAEDFQLDPRNAGSQTANQLSEPAIPNKLGTDDDLNLDKLEKQAISQALKQHGFNISHAAKTLGLTRAALYRRMEKHGL
ncbi:sigma-54 dependent transcriptional regulator [Alteromonas sp. ASW11-36]|uniref:Sigma-54 dependent transcriptional regulator n=1 Tax=Alteromonas arenosi TaxID=3055817 RepID=A0ABT7SZS9_9ALTE|nr:sigma-54 dependent transcriptional regulator [Alteromonas sp. ASW11-36]MDM7861044.1 sigma-54 dependent transcriptional regulator [Alteromonas sp. ASW11-36]